MLNALLDTTDAVDRKNMFHTGLPSINVYLENLSNYLVTDIIVPKIRTLLGPTERSDI